jgi:hypothetical protein
MKKIRAGILCAVAALAQGACAEEVTTADYARAEGFLSYNTAPLVL